MALSDKDILITPNVGQAADPKIEFKGADASVGAQTITLSVYPTSNGTLSFEGSAGQLFSITNDLTGTLFSVNDVSGIPSIEVNADGTISLAEFSGNVGIGTSSPDAPLTVRQSAPLGTSVSVASVNIIAEHLDTSSGVNFLDFHYYGGGVGGSPFIRTKKARGSVASPTIVANNEVTARIGGMGYDGSNFIDNALIRFMVNGTPSLNNMPGSIEFWTTTTTALTQKMIINAAGNVGIGTSSPAAKLDVRGTLASTSSGGITAAVSTVTSGTPSLSAAAYGSFSNHATAFYTNTTERMRIDTSGNLLVGTTSNSPAGTTAQFVNEWSGGSKWGASFNQTVSSGTSYTHINFSTAGVTVGSIGANDTATSYNISSDYRLKEDVQPMADSVTRLMALKPVNFAWKSNGSRVDGFLAHEAQEVVPEAVTGQKDAVDDEGNPQYQGIDQSKLVPLLTAALQDAIKRIETLESEINTLKGT